MKIPFVNVLFFYLNYNHTQKVCDSSIIEITPLYLSENKIKETLFSADIMKKRYERKDRLFCMLEEDRPVSFIWSRISKKHFIGEINRTIKFNCSINFLYDAKTIPEARGKGYYTYLLKYLSGASATPSLIYADSRNIASNRGISRAGFAKEFSVIKVGYWSLLYEKKASDLKYKFLK